MGEGEAVRTQSEFSITFSCLGPIRILTNLIQRVNRNVWSTCCNIIVIVDNTNITFSQRFRILKAWTACFWKAVSSTLYGRAVMTNFQSGKMLYSYLSFSNFVLAGCHAFWPANICLGMSFYGQKQRKNAWKLSKIYFFIMLNWGSSQCKEF